MNEIRILPAPGGCRVGLRVMPGSPEDRLEGRFGDRLRIRVRAAAEKGKANRAVIRLLSNLLRIPAGRIEIVAGHGSRDKTVLFHGLTPETVRSLLTEST